MESSTYLCTVRRPCFVEEDDGLASLAEAEAGFSGNHHALFFKSSSQKRDNYRVFSPPGSSSLRSPRGYDSRFEEHHHQNHHPHFLEACFLCKKPLGDNRDIFMYRGDTPFCSEACRQEQIEIDEAKEKNWNLSSSSMKVIRKEQQKSSPNKSQNYRVRTGTVAAA